ncbi:MAG: hypothetical protein U1F07_01215 [Rubrivivax sp.]
MLRQGCTTKGAAIGRFPAQPLRAEPGIDGAARGDPDAAQATGDGLLHTRGRRPVVRRGLLRLRAAPSQGGQPIVMHEVLIADGEPDVVVTLDDRMKRAGCAVPVACDGEAAPARPARVRLEVTMPGRSGFELCRALRADARTRKPFAARAPAAKEKELLE